VGFNTEKRTPVQMLLQTAPFLCFLPFVTKLSPWEYVGVYTLTLPFMHSFGLLALRTQTVGLSLACLLILVEAAVYYTPKKNILDQSSTVSLSCFIVFVLSGAAVLLPHITQALAVNPAFHYLQAIGVYSMWVSRGNESDILSRQHVKGACTTLIMTNFVVSFIFFFTKVTGHAVLYVGDHYQHKFLAQEVFMALFYPSIILAAAHGDTVKTQHKFLQVMMDVLLYFDNLLNPFLLFGPPFLHTSSEMFVAIFHSQSNWIQLLNALACFSSVALLSICWEYCLQRKEIHSLLGKYNKRYNNDLQMNVLDEECFTVEDSTLDDINEAEPEPVNK
jgi:hypothetical protein